MNNKQRETAYKGKFKNVNKGSRFNVEQFIKKYKTITKYNLKISLSIRKVIDAAYIKKQSIFT